MPDKSKQNSKRQSGTQKDSQCRKPNEFAHPSHLQVVPKYGAVKDEVDRGYDRCSHGHMKLSGEQRHRTTAATSTNHPCHPDSMDIDQGSRSYTHDMLTDSLSSSPNSLYGIEAVVNVNCIDDGPIAEAVNVGAMTPIAVVNVSNPLSILAIPTASIQFMFDVEITGNTKSTGVAVAVTEIVAGVIIPGNGGKRTKSDAKTGDRRLIMTKMDFGLVRDMFLGSKLASLAWFTIKAHTPTSKAFQPPRPCQVVRDLKVIRAGLQVLDLASETTVVYVLPKFQLGHPGYGGPMWSESSESGRPAVHISVACSDLFAARRKSLHKVQCLQVSKVYWGWIQMSRIA
ncbi:hypothetical protein QBC36DRAFT_308705 [Triangularia setosa]|uniref:Uncharacterized protein n=1 Tax=Triangularia setosa TaxID=2587417 RepID=A0AAN6WBV4_9PEZI|nr:hypothetical protein QBC36DRAFT_308705 [Podospora setosa]